MKICKCKNCNERHIAWYDDDIADKDYIKDFCNCKKTKLEFIPTTEYTRSEIIELLCGELENWNHHTLCSIIDDVLEPIESTETVLKCANALLKGLDCKLIGE